MDLTGNIVINSFSMMILLILTVHSRKGTGRSAFPDRLFQWIIWGTALMLVVDTMGRFDGRPGTVYSLFNRVGNFVLFLLNPALPMLWVAYAYAQVYQVERLPKGVVILGGSIFTIHTLAVIATQFTGWFYTIDSQNIYHRGPLYLLSTVPTLSCLFFAMAVILLNRKKMEKRHYRSLLFFGIPPLLASILHSLIYGVAIMFCGVVLSILVVFLNIQNQSLITDHLTGVYNRKGFDMHLREKIRGSAGGRAFSAILMDYDHFKQVNDTYGHDMGDKALQKSAELLKSSIRRSDFIARFGGDEFVILLDTASKTELEAIVQRINDTVASFNQGNRLPFAIGLSAGYAVYDAAARPEAEDFVKQLDRMMYQMKKAL